MTEPKIEFCASCGASIARGAHYCAECGEPTRYGRRERSKARAAEDRDLRVRVRVLAIGFVGVLVAMIAIRALDLDDTPSYLLFAAAQVGLGAIGCWLLGRGALRGALGRRPDARALGLACAVPVASLLVAFGWVALLHALVDDGSEWVDDDPTPLLVALVMTAVLPALVEEWIDRGVLWFALRPVASRGVTIVATATLFGFAHALNGLFILEVPHRFVMGLMLGWLRATTGSLWPCVLAHFLHNAVAVAID